MCSRTACADASRSPTRRMNRRWRLSCARSAPGRRRVRLSARPTEIARLLRGMGEQVSDYEIVPFTGTELDAAKLAVRTVREGRADMLMKGLLHTADFARAILNRETGLMPQTGRRLLSQCGFFQYDGGSF